MTASFGEIAVRKKCHPDPRAQLIVVQFGPVSRLLGARRSAN